LKDVALAVGAALEQHEITAVLTGGSAATVHSEGTYSSTDLDFVLRTRTRQAVLDAAMAAVGFRREGARYTHPKSPFWIEFPAGPLAVGDDHDIRPVQITGVLGRALILSATDSCRDRLAAFYHWSDRQSLEAAVKIALHSKVDLAAIREWSRREGHLDGFRTFVKEIDRCRPGQRRRRP